MTLKKDAAASSFAELDDLQVSLQKELTESRQAVRANLESHLPWLEEVLAHMETFPPFRSLVLALSTRLFADTGEEPRHVSSVLEYLHMAALIHQNIVLTEEMRRTQKALSSIWKNEASVLLGDYLLAISFQTMTRLGNFELLDTISATTKAIARGQVLSISPFSWNEAKAHMLAIVQNRDASLFQAGAKSGAILGKAPPKIQEALRDYGFHLGMGIQLWQDLAAAQNRETLRQHLENRHLFFPLCCLMEQMQQQGEAELLKKILDAPSFSENDLRTLQDYFQQFEVYAETHQTLTHHLQQSTESLAGLKNLEVAPLVKFAQFFQKNRVFPEVRIS